MEWLARLRALELIDELTYLLHRIEEEVQNSDEYTKELRALLEIAPATIEFGSYIKQLDEVA